MKLPASVRIRMLTDEQSCEPDRCDMPLAFITGRSRVEGRPVLIAATDSEPAPPVDMLASMSAMIRICEVAHNNRMPLVLLLDTPGHGHTTGGRTPVPRDGASLLADPRGVGGGGTLRRLVSRARCRKSARSSA